LVIITAGVVNLSPSSLLSNKLLVYVRLSDGGVADVVMFTGGET